MAEYTVTGVRYQMPEEWTYEERTEAAERFVAGLEMGQKVVLVAEPENPVDENAIAVYIDWERIGYISQEDVAEVHTLLDEDHQCDAVVVRKDDHITFFVSIPGAPEKIQQQAPPSRTLPESPLGKEVRMPYTKEESALQAMASRLIRIEPRKENLQAIIELAEHYVPHLKTSICQEEILWMNRVEKMLGKIRRKGREWGLSEEALTRLKKLHGRVRASVADMHRPAEHWEKQVFEHHIDTIKANERITHCLYSKYCKTFLGAKDFPEADKNKVVSERDRLLGWLDAMPWSELRNPKDLKAMAQKVLYLRLCRQEMYDLCSVLLLLDKLEAALAEKTFSQSEALERLTPIFYGNSDEASRFLQQVQGMKAVQITELVNQLAEKRLVSNVSKHRVLWQVLHDYGIYDKSESNWNMQVK